MGRGQDARIVHITEKLGHIDDQENPGWRVIEEQLEQNAMRERENAIARTTINVSLAIRSALDRIAEHRASKSQYLIMDAQSKMDTK